jgi:hypothetical protein
VTSFFRCLRRGFLLVFALSGTGCGGAAAPEPKAPDAEAEPAESSDSGESDSEDSSESADASADTGSESAGSSDPCADGSCFRCGSGICPAGFYCDESTPGGAGCSWLPACGSKSTCACLERTLEGCTCTEKSGAAFVTCS